MHRLVLITAALFSGCASLPEGVQMTDDERSACAAAGCTVWTQTELERIVGLALQKGFQEGRKRGLSL